MTESAADFVKTWWPVASGLSVAAYVAWRRVVKPRLLRPIHDFFERLGSTMDKVDAMSTALGKNGGKSLADLIHATSRETAITGIRVSWLIDQMERPMFELAPDGRNLRINSRFTDVFGYTPAQMLNQGWVVVIHEPDRDSFMRAWDHALDDRRLFEATVRVITRSRVVQHARITIEPQLSESSGELLRWLGRVETMSAGAVS